ncbi:hypothetical protein H9L05_19855 [Hymenobacter qilianensis]|uniref:UDP-2,4-diacetamido-2,4, 6-trideoxy-beta-L-altropyranose hydrolase n=1 Tax=Hymenobacter qilianensis TaxID=1385715 RepID=A0A7H0GUZ6_9BACT|nr:hypothetical protein [Hymenobacter qilianensis]QNP52112.1 hypothetical protein H9L05_19855 [Hymenobacter qilianensis]
MTTDPSLPRLVLRADGNPRIGLGHVMRLLALADILRDEFGCVFVIQEPDAVLLIQLQKSCLEVVEMPPSLRVVSQPGWPSTCCALVTFWCLMATALSSVISKPCALM